MSIKRESGISEDFYQPQHKTKIYLKFFAIIISALMICWIFDVCFFFSSVFVVAATAPSTTTAPVKSIPVDPCDPVFKQDMKDLWNNICDNKEGISQNLQDLFDPTKCEMDKAVETYNSTICGEKRTIDSCKTKEGPSMGKFGLSIEGTIYISSKSDQSTEISEASSMTVKQTLSDKSVIYKIPSTTTPPKNQLDLNYYCEELNGNDNTQQKVKELKSMSEVESGKSDLTKFSFSNLKLGCDTKDLEKGMNLNSKELLANSQKLKSNVGKVKESFGTNGKFINDIDKLNSGDIQKLADGDLTKTADPAKCKEALTNLSNVVKKINNCKKYIQTSLDNLEASANKLETLSPKIDKYGISGQFQLTQEGYLRTVDSQIVNIANQAIKPTTENVGTPSGLDICKTTDGVFVGCLKSGESANSGLFGGSVSLTGQGFKSDSQSRTVNLMTASATGNTMGWFKGTTNAAWDCLDQRNTCFTVNNDEICTSFFKKWFLGQGSGWKAWIGWGALLAAVGGGLGALLAFMSKKKKKSSGGTPALGNRTNNQTQGQCSAPGGSNDPTIGGIVTDKSGTTHASTCITTTKIRVFYCKTATTYDSQEKDCPTGTSCVTVPNTTYAACRPTTPACVNDSQCVCTPEAGTPKCENGACTCIARPSCTDTDGRNYNTQGNITLSSGLTFTDECVTADQLKEYYCASGASQGYSTDLVLCSTVTGNPTSNCTAGKCN